MCALWKIIALIIYTNFLQNGNCALFEDNNYEHEPVTCKENEFTCDLFQCIPESNVCNGIKDCDNIIDENWFSCENKTCNPYEFFCSYGACIAMNKVCDLKWDCADGSDEVGCEKPLNNFTCPKSQISCRSENQCIYTHERCDGIRNCNDSSDETYQACFGIKCESDSFQCNYGACIPSEGRCDNQIDCADGSDELNCTNTSVDVSNSTLCGENGYKCPSGMCIKLNQLCNGIRDCEDGGDETEKQCSSFNCDVWEYRCSSGACVPFKNMTCSHCVDQTMNKQWSIGNKIFYCMDGKLIVQDLPRLPPPPPTAPAPTRPAYTTTSRPTRATTWKQPDLYEISEISETTTSLPATTPSSDRYPPLTIGGIDFGSGSAFSGGSDSSVYNSRPQYPKNKCLFPERPKNGDYSSPTVKEIIPNAVAPKFTLLQFVCEDDYELNGEAFIVCSGKKWNHLPPECARKCPPLEESDKHEIACSYENREVDCEEPFEGVVANVQCKEAFEVQNIVFQPTNGIRCENGSWSSELFNCEPECGTVIPKAQALVIKGYTATKGEYPWHAGVYQKIEGVYDQMCGGTIITDKFVISAAHCFWDWTENRKKIDKDEFGVAVGKFYRAWNNSEDHHAQYFKVDKITLPDKFRADSNSFANDIAIITIHGVIEFTALVRPVCLDYSNTLSKVLLKPGAFGAVVGWGLTEEFGQASEKLQAVQMPYVEYDKCVNELPLDFRPFITNDKLCAGYKNGTSICQGDSGGGIAFRRSNRYFIQGVVSVAPAKGSTCDSFQFVAFTNIGSHLKWIEEVESNDLEEDDDFDIDIK